MWFRIKKKSLNLKEQLKINLKKKSLNNHNFNAACLNNKKKNLKNISL